MPTAIDGLKVCTACKERLPVSRFYSHAALGDGLNPRCKRCLNASDKAWRDTHPDRVAERQRWSRLKHRYGITRAEYEALVRTQGLACAICGRSDGTNGGNRLAVDHDHATGRVRGLLCLTCNLAVGQLKDDPGLLERAAEYLRNPPFHSLNTEA